MEILGTSQHKGVFAFHYIANHKLRHIHKDDREEVKQKIRESVKDIPGFKAYKPEPQELKSPKDICDVIVHPNVENS